MTCVDPNHFYILDGAIVPQPWMQMRQVDSKTVVAKSGTYGHSGGATKNDLLQTVTAKYENDTPVPQWVYGLVTRGGSKVTLQARSRAGISLLTGQLLGEGAIPMVEASLLGCGLDVGRGGFLTAGTEYAITEVRQNTCTIPLCPEQTGWKRVDPNITLYARADTRFVSSYWEGTDPNNGNGSADSETTYVAGDLRIDLYAIPIFE